MQQHKHRNEYRSLVGLKDALKAEDVVLLVGGHQVGHGQHFGVLLVGGSLLRIKGIHCALHQHCRQHQVLEALYPPHRARLIIALEGLPHKSQSFQQAAPQTTACRVSLHSKRGLLQTPRALYVQRPETQYGNFSAFRQELSTDRCGCVFVKSCSNRGLKTGGQRVC